MWGVLLAAIVGVGRPLALSMGRRLAPSFEPGSRRRWLWGGVWPSVLEGSGHFMSSEWRCLSGERRSAPVLGGRRPPMMAGWRCLASWLRLPQALVVGGRGPAWGLRLAPALASGGGSGGSVERWVWRPTPMALAVGGCCVREGAASAARAWRRAVRWRRWGSGLSLLVAFSSSAAGGCWLWWGAAPAVDGVLAASPAAVACLGAVAVVGYRV